MKIDWPTKILILLIALSAVVFAVNVAAFITKPSSWMNAVAAVAVAGCLSWVLGCLCKDRAARKHVSHEGNELT